MAISKCIPLDAPNNQWSYCPSGAAALIFFALFALTTLLHFFQAIIHRSGFCWVIIMGGLWETLSFAARIISARNPTQKGSYDASFLLVLLAPLSINAFDYMLLGRMMKSFLPGESLMGIRRMGLVFVSCDVISFIVQIGGGLLSLSKTVKTAKLGLHIVTAGVIFQECLIVLFMFLSVQFSNKLKATPLTNSTKRGPLKLVWVLRCSLLLITYRIIFRIVEFSASQGSSINTYINHHEFFLYVFDSLPMFFALLLMNIWHPGKVLKGVEGREGKFGGYDGVPLQPQQPQSQQGWGYQ